MPSSERGGGFVRGGLLLVALATGLPAGLAAEKPPTYEQQVLPIFREKCCGCHNPGKRAGGLDLTSYQQLQAGGNSGEVVAAGDPDGSYLWQVASHESEPVMPPNADRIPDDMLAAIKAWIVGGLVERDGAKPVATGPVTKLALDPGAIVTPEGEPVMPPRLSLKVMTHGLRPTTVTGLDASPHGDLLAVGGRQQVLLVSPTTRQLLGVLPFPEGNCKTLRFSRNARLLLTAGGIAAKRGRVVLWDVASGTRLAALGDEYDEVLAADLSADQRLVALGGAAKVVRLVTTEDGQEESTITKHTDWITSVAFSPDSVLLATGDRAGNLFLWESFGAREWAVLKGHTGGITAVSWRGDGLVVASAAEDGTIHLWDADQGTKIRSWAAHAGGTSDVRWLRDGSLVSTGRDCRVKHWGGDGKLKRDLGAMADIGVRVAVNDSQTSVSASDWTGTITVWSLTDASQQGVIEANPPSLETRIAEAERQLATARQACDAQRAKERERRAAADEQVSRSQVAQAAAETALAKAEAQREQARQQVAAAKQQLAKAKQAASNVLAGEGSDAAEEPAETRPAAGEQAVAAEQHHAEAVTQAKAQLSKATEATKRAAQAVQEAAAEVAKATAARDSIIKAETQATADAEAGRTAAEQVLTRWQDERAFAEQAAAQR